VATGKLIVQRAQVWCHTTYAQAGISTVQLLLKPEAALDTMQFTYPEDYLVRARR
jgi:hypothetical protein